MALLGALGLLLGTGCDRATSGSSLTLWHPWGGAELQALKKAIRRYEQAHPGTEVVALQVPSDKLQDKYLRSSAANGGPDLVIGPVDWIGKLAQSEVIAPVEADLTPAELQRYLPVSLEALRYHKHLYALPESMETVALYYNKRLMIAPPPKTLQELFVRANSTDYWHGDYLFAYNTQFFFTAGYLFGMGGSLLTPDGGAKLDTLGARNWLKFLHDLKVHPKIAAKSDYGRADALFRDGKAAMTVNGPWALGDYQKALGKDLGIALLPQVNESHGPKPFVGVKCFMFNPNSKGQARQRAIDFATFMTSKDIATLMQREAGHIPAVRDVIIPPGDPLESFAKQALLGTPLPPNPEMKEVWAPMDQAIEKVMTEAASPDAAIMDAQKVISAKIEAVRQQ